MKFTASITKFVDSLTDEQALLLGGELDQGSAGKVLDALTQRLRSMSNEQRRGALGRMQQQLSTRID